MLSISIFCGEIFFLLLADVEHSPGDEFSGILKKILRFMWVWCQRIGDIKLVMITTPATTIFRKPNVKAQLPKTITYIYRQGEVR